MAIKCANCGQVLPKDNARFCNSCGASLRPPPQNSQQGAARGPLTERPGGARELKGYPPGGTPGAPLQQVPLRTPTTPTRPGLYEQIAQQPPSRPAGADDIGPSAERVSNPSRPVPIDRPPSWMRTLDRGTRTGEPTQKDEAPQRDLHARVWEKNEPDRPSFSEEDTIFPDESAVFPEDAVEDLPTAHMEANIPESPVQKPAGPQGARESKGAPQEGAIHRAPTVWDSHLDDVAQLSTSRLESQRQVKSEEPSNQQGQPAMREGGVTFQKPPLTPQLRPHTPFAEARFIPPSPAQKTKQPGLVPPTPVGVNLSRPAPMDRPMATRQGMSRKRLVIVLALLFVLVASGIATWIIAFKPFAVASITQPWQQFCEAGPGVSGQYPTGWMKQVDQNQGVRFSDGTDQFGIVSVAANGQDAGTYLRKEASQLGITGLKIGTPVSFAGTSWQQAQGSLLQSQTGVTYTEALLVTVHSNRLFTVMQMAPPGTYSEEDATIFSGMRSSFQFSNSCP